METDTTLDPDTAAAVALGRARTRAALDLVLARDIPAVLEDEGVRPAARRIAHLQALEWAGKWGSPYMGSVSPYTDQTREAASLGVDSIEIPEDLGYLDGAIEVGYMVARHAGLTPAAEGWAGPAEGWDGTAMGRRVLAGRASLYGSASYNVGHYAVVTAVEHAGSGYRDFDLRVTVLTYGGTGRGTVAVGEFIAHRTNSGRWERAHYMKESRPCEGCLRARYDALANEDEWRAPCDHTTAPLTAGVVTGSPGARFALGTGGYDAYAEFIRQWGRDGLDAIAKSGWLGEKPEGISSEAVEVAAPWIPALATLDAEPVVADPPRPQRMQPLETRIIPGGEGVAGRIAAALGGRAGWTRCVHPDGTVSGDAFDPADAAAKGGVVVVTAYPDDDAESGEWILPTEAV